MLRTFLLTLLSLLIVKPSWATQPRYCSQLRTAIAAEQQQGNFGRLRNLVPSLVGQLCTDGTPSFQVMGTTLQSLIASGFELYSVSMFFNEREYEIITRFGSIRSYQLDNLTWANLPAGSYRYTLLLRRTTQEGDQRHRQGRIDQVRIPISIIVSTGQRRRQFGVSGFDVRYVSGGYPSIGGHGASSSAGN